MLSDKPPIVDDASAVSETLLGDLIKQLATLSSVFHKPPSTFLNAKFVAVKSGEERHFLLNDLKY